MCVVDLGLCEACNGRAASVVKGGCQLCWTCEAETAVRPTLIPREQARAARAEAARVAAEETQARAARVTAQRELRRERQRQALLEAEQEALRAEREAQRARNREARERREREGRRLEREREVAAQLELKIAARRAAEQAETWLPWAGLGVLGIVAAFWSPIPFPPGLFIGAALVGGALVCGKEYLDNNVELALVIGASTIGVATLIHFFLAAILAWVLNVALFAVLGYFAGVIVARSFY